MRTMTGFGQPALSQRKIRALELQSGFKPEEGGRGGGAHNYNLPIVRAQEVASAEQAERAYERFVANWKTHASKSKPRRDIS